jgi:glucose/arabinose dehydrogenase
MSAGRRFLGTLAAILVAAPVLAGAAPARPLSATMPRALEPGFTVTPYAATGGTPSSLAFGPDTRDGAKGRRLYVTDNSGGTLLAIDDTNGVGSAPTVFADGFRSPLGVVADEDGVVFVADAEAAREGPFGLRSYGRVWRVEDTDGDGVADKQYVVLKDLPNGRHNTNGLAFGPDGMLYVANGNSTDDGTEGGESEVVPWSGSVVRVDPNARNVSITDLPRRKTLVAHGWRNVYDLAFSPFDETKLFVPMNGSDDAREGSAGENPADPDLGDSDDLLFATDVDDKRIDDFGFPSCLYNVAERGNLKPYDNPNKSTIKKFGKCPKNVPRPVSSFGLHTSSDGLAFQVTDAWGDDHRDNVFVAQWGNLFGPPAGHNIIRVELNGSGRKVIAQSDFLDIDTPLDLTFDAEGAMYVADFSGQIFKVDSAI